MSDLIERKAAIERIESEYKKWGEEYDILQVLGDLEDLPSAQTEIIACGDCKHWICHDRRCGYWNHGVKPLEWCCHAERRTDE